jgi:SnoaL-like domain
VATISVDARTRRLFETIDAMDAEGFAAAFTPEGSFRFGNAGPVTGREAVRDAVAGFFASLGGLSHRVTGVWTGTWEHGPVRSVEAEVTYTRKDGSVTPPIPATSTLRMRGDLIQDYRIFADLAPLFATGPDPV